MRSWGNEMVVERFSRKQKDEEKERFRERERERGRGTFIESLCREQPKVGNPKPTLQISCEPK